MENQKQLRKCTTGVAFAVDVDPAIDRLNIPWEFSFQPAEMVKTASVVYGDNKIRIVLELNTIDIVACDEAGIQTTFTVPGFQPGAIE